MSDNIPNESTAPAPSKKSKKQKYDKTQKLPTPPPDPKEDVQEKDKEIFEYLERLHKSFNNSASIFAPVVATEEAFDHLEKLYKLMEQMLKLREQNAKLHRRIRDLEHFNNLEKMHKQIDMAGVERDCPELDRDTAFAETILESILQDSTKKDYHQYQKQKSLTPTRLRPSILRKSRRGSGTEKQVTLEDDNSVQQDQNYESREKSGKPAKISKWTKVKAAFRWEKASTSVSDTKSQDSGIHVPVNLEIARYLRVPSTSDDTGHSPGDSAAGISTPGSLSTASSNDDFHREDLRIHCEDFRSSDDEHSHQNYIPHSKDDHSKSHQKFHRTPWAKMKDIIQTRNSFKKKHRLSAASDEIQIDVELCSDNEDVFEDECKSKVQQISSSPSPNPGPNAYVKVHSNDVPADIVERYQRVLSEDNSSDSDRKVSKWTRVKKAFLTSDNDLSKERNEETTVEDEIQSNYRKLQKKLSLEFQDKLNEWERMKQNSPGVSNPSSPASFIEENRDPQFIKKMEEWQKIKSQSPKTVHRPNQFMGEYDIPPEFKKKLQEWEKIKKSSPNESSSSSTKKKLGDAPKWKSLSGHRPETTHAFEIPALSEDFRKKLEEWKQIKASGGASWNLEQKKLKEKTPSPKLSRKNSSPKYGKKQKDQEKELHWFEKELGKIEKEKQRLERERQKFLEREERLSKLRRSMVASNKKEVLIHTPSGFYRFEGISRKFTQKLYEWEKAKGIGPEASTFALLTSSLTPEYRPISKRHSTSNTPPLVRSKSADSIAISALNLTCPLMSHQPSSLSLNDVDDLEKECLADSKSSSMQYLMDSQEALNQDEPEAVLVEVEDYEEETAAPLHTFVEKHQLPVYQRQECKPLCEGETVAAPKIRRSESTRAQTNYNLIEDLVNSLRSVAENEAEIKNLFSGQEISKNTEELKTLNDTQIQVVKTISEKLLKLQEANIVVASKITKEEEGHTFTGNLTDILEAVQDLSSEGLQLAEQLEHHIVNRFNQETLSFTSCNNVTFEIVKEIRNRILELRRHLSYICAASDLTAPKRKRSSTKKVVHKTISNESKDSRCDTSETNSRQNSQKEKRYVKSENANKNSQGAVKKRIRYRQKNLQKSVPDTDEDDEDLETPKKTVRQHKKLTRTRSISESSVLKPEHFETKVDEKVSILMGTKPAEADLVGDNVEKTHLPADSPITLFVKTTRKLFTPIAESGLKMQKPAEDALDDTRNVDTLQDTQKREDIKKDNVTHLPPLPASPVPQRKIFKEVSPSIRVMLAKYNQKLEQEIGTKSGGSSGSNSPIAWRSPTSERRVKAQTEKYQEELKKLSPLLGGRREVQKSASAGYLHTSNKQITIPVRKNSLNNECCSASATSDVNAPKNKSCEGNQKHLTLDISLTNRNENETFSRHSPEIRWKKIQKAKEEFLNSPVSAPPQFNEEVLKFPARNRLSQISVESESSYDSAFAGNLIKSASAGMINIDPDAYRQFDTEYHADGYVSLPRSQKKTREGLLSGKFAFSSIASKFRRVKMRRGKDKDKEKDKDGKMNAVSALCRQSLVVDINPENGGENTSSSSISNNNNNNNTDFLGNSRNDAVDNNRSPATPASISKSNSWIKRPKFFKK